jgi:hypothetical protein
MQGQFTDALVQVGSFGDIDDQPELGGKGLAAL